MRLVSRTLIVAVGSPGPDRAVVRTIAASSLFASNVPCGVRTRNRSFHAMQDRP